MYEVTMEELSVFVALGFCCGVFASVFLGRFFEVVHLHRMVRETTIHLIWMLAKMTEDIHFLHQLRLPVEQDAAKMLQLLVAHVLFAALRLVGLEVLELRAR